MKIIWNLDKVLFVGLVLLVGLAGTAFSATYYVCDCGPGSATGCVVGDDNRTPIQAQNPATPWRTYQKAQSQFEFLQAGDQILFARGGSFAATEEHWVNYNCTADNRCIIADYTPPWASGNEDRPLLTNTSGGIFRFEDGGDPDPDGGYIVRNLRLKGGGVESAFFFYNDVDDVLLDNLVIDGFGIAVCIEGSNPPNPPGSSDGRNSRIVLKNSLIVNNGTMGFLGRLYNGLIENNDFENNGFAVSSADEAIRNHNLYISAGINSTIRNNRLYHSAMFGGSCQGVSLVVHGNSQHLTIEGNVVREDVGAANNTCWGIAVDPGYGPDDEDGGAENFSGTVIRGNKIINTGNIAIGAASCPDSVIENNVIIHEQSFGTTGIAVPDRDRGSNDVADNNMIVRNNSIYIATPDSTGISVGGEGSHHTVVSNTVQFAGTGYFTFLNLNLPFTNYAAVDYNLCYMPNADNEIWEKSRNLSLAAWKTASTFDLHSKIANPLFTNPANGDLSISGVTSPLVGAGHPTLSASKDFNGRDRGVSPAIGAFEFGSTPSMVTIISPNGREIWMVGSFHNITWKTTGTIPKVKIEVSIDKGSTWSNVIAATANDGSHAWTIPNTPSSQCLIRISDVANAAIKDISNTVFAIMMNLDLQAERREIKAFSILRHYGQIQFMAGYFGGLVSQYRLMRCQGSGAFALLRTIAPYELQNNQFQMQDKYLEKDITYTYRVEAYDATEQLVGISSEKTI
jgi:hypothetical protein